MEKTLEEKILDRALEEATRYISENIKCSPQQCPVRAFDRECGGACEASWYMYFFTRARDSVLKEAQRIGYDD